MCEWWTYGCGHVVRTPCPRPVDAGTSSSDHYSSRLRSSTSSSSGSASSGGSTRSDATLVSTAPSSTHNTTATVSMFCQGFPQSPKKTKNPCYPCILIDARCKILAEAPEVRAKEEQLKREGLSRTIAKGPDGQYVDAFGRKFVAEDAFYQEETSGPYGPAGSGTRQRGFTDGTRGGGDRGNTNGFVRQNANSTAPARDYGRQRGFTDGGGNGSGYGGNGTRAGFLAANGKGHNAGQFQSRQHGYGQQGGQVQLDALNHQNAFIQQTAFGGYGNGACHNTNAAIGYSQRAYGNGGNLLGGAGWSNTNGFGQSLNEYGREDPFVSNQYGY